MLHAEIFRLMKRLEKMISCNKTWYLNLKYFILIQNMCSELQYGILTNN